MKRSSLIRIICLLAFAAVLLAACSQNRPELPTVETNPPRMPIQVPDDPSRAAQFGVLLQADSSIEAEYEPRTDSDSSSLWAAASKDPVFVEEIPTVLKASIRGTPDSSLSYVLTVSNVRDVFLPAGTYTDFTCLVKGSDGSYGYNNVFTIDNYAPGRWDLLVSSGGASVSLTQLAAENGQACSGFSPVDRQSLEVAAANAQSLCDWMEARNPGMHNTHFEMDLQAGELRLLSELEPGAEVDLSLELSWGWSFESDNPVFDQADTLLGNLVAVRCGETLDLAPAAGSSSPEWASTALGVTMLQTLTPMD